MKKIYKESQLLNLSKYPNNVIESIKETVSILNENYGDERDINNDLGGYVIIVENIEEIKVIKKRILNNIIVEYTDLIECKEGVNWTSSLFLLSDDYSIVVVTTEELSKFLLE